MELSFKSSLLEFVIRTSPTYEMATEEGLRPRYAAFRLWEFSWSKKNGFRDLRKVRAKENAERATQIAAETAAMQKLVDQR
jgi:hypothetical protein